MPTQRRRFFAILSGIVAGGLLLRIVFVLAYAPADIPIEDGLWYHGIANLIADGHGFIDPLWYSFLGHSRETAGHPPLWPLVLTPVSWFGGVSVFAHQITQAVVSGLAVFAIGGLGREMAGDRTGLLAGAIAAVYPLFWVTVGDLYSESLYTLVVAAMLWAAYRYLRRPSVLVAVVLGITVALAALCRGEGLLFLPVLVVPVLVVTRAPNVRRPRAIGAALVAVVVVLAPWTVFNITRFTDPVPVSTTFGVVIAGANCPATFGGKQIGSWNIDCAAMKVHGRDDSQLSAALRRRGTEYATDHLGRLPVVVAARLARTYEVYGVDPHGYGPSWLPAFTAAAWYAALLLAIAGAVVLRRRGTSLLPVIATVAVVTITVVFTWGTPRFRVPVDIVAVALTAVALDAWWSRVRPRRAPGTAAVSRP